VDVESVIVQIEEIYLSDRQDRRREKYGGSQRPRSSESYGMESVLPQAHLERNPL
jgi:hypothetical protein